MTDAMTVRGTRILAGGLQMLLQTGVGLGLDRSALMRSADLSEEDLSDRDKYRPFEKMIALGQRIIADCPDTNIGMAAVQHVSPATFGVLGYVISNAPTLHESLSLFVRFQRLLTDGLRWRLELDDEATISLEADPRYLRLGYPIEGILGVWLRLGRMLTGTKWLPTSVELCHAPLGDPGEVETYFGTRVHFRAPRNAMVMPLDTLALPLVVGSISLHPSLQALAAQRLAEIEGPGTFTAQLLEKMFAKLTRQGRLGGNPLRDLGA